MNLYFKHCVFWKLLFTIQIQIYTCYGSESVSGVAYYLENYMRGDLKIHLQSKRSASTGTPKSTNESHAEITTLPTVNVTTVAQASDTTSEAVTESSIGYTVSGSDEDFSYKEDLGENATKTFDHHKYYRSYSKTGMQEASHFWVNLDNMPQEKVVKHDSLSSAYRRALTVALSFAFPFYGHTLHNVTIATGGFLYTGSFLHKWLAATQYIAPLMANFDPSVSKDAAVKYADNGTSLTVQWENVLLQDNRDAGPFTFQVTIHKTGHIVFAYKEIPVIVKLIGDMEHPVKVGLSDAYIVEKTIFYVRKKTIYEYHKIDVKKGLKISNWTAIVFEPLQMCVSFNTCESCLTSQTGFECSWCPSVNRCSDDGLDRHRQVWLEGGCKNVALTNTTSCALLPPPTSAYGAEASLSGASSGKSHSHSNMLIGFFLTSIILVFIGGWVAYAYLNPHTASGQLLIKYRPSTWSWRRGEARYTAATMHSIHM